MQFSISFSLLYVSDSVCIFRCRAINIVMRFESRIVYLSRSASYSLFRFPAGAACESPAVLYCPCNPGLFSRHSSVPLSEAELTKRRPKCKANGSTGKTRPCLGPKSCFVPIHQHPRPSISHISSRFCFLSRFLSSSFLDIASFALSMADRDLRLTAASGL